MREFVKYISLDEISGYQDSIALGIFELGGIKKDKRVKSGYKVALYKIGKDPEEPIESTNKNLH